MKTWRDLNREGRMEMHLPGNGYGENKWKNIHFFFNRIFAKILLGRGKPFIIECMPFR